MVEKMFRVDGMRAYPQGELFFLLPDGLANMYQGLIDGVGSFDPWVRAS